MSPQPTESAPQASCTDSRAPTNVAFIATGIRWVRYVTARMIPDIGASRYFMMQGSKADSVAEPAGESLKFPAIAPYPSSRMPAIRIMVSPMNHSAFLIPLVFTSE